MPSLRSRLDRLAHRWPAPPAGWAWGTPPHALPDADGHIRPRWYDPNCHRIDGDDEESFEDPDDIPPEDPRYPEDPAASEGLSP